tara:strand:+ start:116 stop:298 length:183 start_codon:yes stop_codon:yes gene_type:complete
MDRKNILSEGFFDLLKKFKQKKNYTKTEKSLMRDPKFREKFKKAEKAVDDFLSAVEKADI